MAQARRTRPKKVHPDPPDAPDRWESAPVAVESGAAWDGVDAGADVDVPGHVAGFELRESRWVDADLSGRRFTGFRCRDTRFVYCDLSGAVLDEAVFSRRSRTAG